MGTSSVAQDVPAPARRSSISPDKPMVGRPPGWYYDPDDEAVYRWFDGETWTDHRTDIFVSESPIDGDVRSAAERAN